jgi:arylsulfatase A-like enzyme
VLAVVAAAALGVWFFLPPRPPARAHPNVLIVLWDTTRADHLTFYGHDKPTTPNMAKWAESGVVFEKAISPAMWTVPSHASMYTGLTSTTHGADYDYRWLDGANVTLAETLAAAGYDTYAFSANPNLADNRINLLQGVSTIEMAWRGKFKQPVNQLTRRKLIHRDASTEISPGYPGKKTGHFYYNAAPVTGEALTDWLDSREDKQKPWFAYLNYMEAHKPRVPGLEARKRVVDSPEELELGLSTDLSLENQLLYSVGAKEYTPEQLDAIDAVYDAALTELDDWTGALLTDLKQRGDLEDTIVVFTSDHGENLGDHHLFGHRHGLYQALVHVPLVISYPGKLAPRRVAETTSNLDLYYTIARLAGIEPPAAPQPMFRTDLTTGTTAAVFAETIGIDREGIQRVVRNDVDAERWMHTFQSVIASGWKLIETSKGEKELYNLAIDPDELTDLSSTEPAKLAELDQMLDAPFASVPPYDPTKRVAGDGPVQDDAETREALEALGYVETPEAGADPCAAAEGDVKARCQRTEAACGPLPVANAAKCRAAAAQCAPGATGEDCLREVERVAGRFLQRRNNGGQ